MQRSERCRERSLQRPGWAGNAAYNIPGPIRVASWGEPASKNYRRYRGFWACQHIIKPGKKWDNHDDQHNHHNHGDKYPQAAVAAGSCLLDSKWIRRCRQG